MTLDCPLCSAPMSPRPGSDFRLPGRAEMMEEACVLGWAAGPGGLTLEPGAFPAKGISKSRKEGSGEGEEEGGGRKDGTGPSWE